MKKLFSSVILAIAFASVCVAQTPSQFIPRVNATGINAGTNTHLQSPTIISPLRLDIPNVLPTANGNLQFLLRVSGNSNLLSSSLMILDTTTGELIVNGGGITNLPASAQTPWNQDVDSAGFNLTNSVNSDFRYTDSSGNARMKFDNGIHFEDVGGNARFEAEQFGVDGDTSVRDALGNDRLVFEQDGMNAGESRMLDANGVDRLMFEQDGASAGETYIKDANGNKRFSAEQDGASAGNTQILDAGGNERFLAEQDGSGAGDTKLSDASGTERFTAHQNADGTGDTSITDAAGNERVFLGQNGMGNGDTFFKDGNNVERFRADQDGMGVGDTTLNDAAGNPQISINTTGISGNAFGLTNMLEKNIAVTTNGWGNSVLNFSLGTQIETNLTSGLTLTGIDGFVTSNLNWQVIGLYTDGSIRTVTVPAPWVVSGFTSATAVDIPANTFAKLTVESVIGRRTNATIEIFTP